MLVSIVTHDPFLAAFSLDGLSARFHFCSSTVRHYAHAPDSETVSLSSGHYLKSLITL